MDLAGGLSRRQLDNCEKSVAAQSASRYSSIQFFASLRKWIGARNPVRIGSSCAAVTGYNFPWASPRKLSGVKAGRRCVPHRHHTPGARIFVRSTSFVPCRGGCASRPRRLNKRRYNKRARKNFFAKRRMRAGRCGLGQTSPTLGVGGYLLCEIAQYVLSYSV